MINYLSHLLVMIGIYSILAYSMNLVLGYGGLLTFCHAAFYGIGAYTYTLLTIGASHSSIPEQVLLTAALPFPQAMLGAAIGAAIAALLIGIVILRFRGDYFIFSTLGFQIIVFVILDKWTGLARGSFGIYDIPRPELFGWQISETWQYVVLVAGVNAIILPLLFLLYRSPFGLSLKSLREDERAAESLGISSLYQHLSAFVIAGACAGVAGALFACYVTYINPTSFSLRESIFLITLLLLGGTGNIQGPIIGVLVMILLPEVLRFLGLPDDVAPNIREIIYGLALISLMYWRPQGLKGEFVVR